MIYDVAIAGAGMVGLSTAYQILNAFPDVKLVVLEKEEQVAHHQTGHNSGVLHSGIYYKPGSYKAKNCLSGYQMLMQFCDAHQIEYRLIGKLIVATEPEQLPKLEQIHQNGIQNGLQGLQVLSAGAVREIEPAVRCLQAISVPQAGIIDYRMVASKLRVVIEKKGAVVWTGKKLEKIHQVDQGIRLQCADGSVVETKFFINCGGLQSDRIARMAGLKTNFRIIPFKGNYFRLQASKKDIVQRLIYPVPDPRFPFLGIHYTRLINGDQTLGPNAVLSLDREGYRSGAFNQQDAWDILSFPGFWKLIARHWRTGMGEYLRNFSPAYFAKKASEMTPGIRSEDLEPAGSGIRAQVVDDQGQMIEDFLSLRAPRMIHVCNAPSPAATAGLAIGRQIADWYAEMRP